MSTTMTQYETKFEFDTLVARKRNTYWFLDKIFRSQTIQGATGRKVVPVSKEEYDRRIENIKDYEHSPLAHIYDEANTPKSWDEWISEWEYDLPELAVESAPSPAWDIVQEREECYDVEWVGSGRIFSQLTDENVGEFFDEIYDHMTLERAIAAERDEEWAYQEQ